MIRSGYIIISSNKLLPKKGQVKAAFLFTLRDCFEYSWKLYFCNDYYVYMSNCCSLSNCCSFDF